MFMATKPPKTTRAQKPTPDNPRFHYVVTKKLAPKKAFALWKEKPGAIDELCEALSAGQSLLNWCRSNDFPYMRTVHWLEDDAEREEKYARARGVRADTLADELVSIADEEVAEDILDPAGNVVGTRLDSTAVARNRLRVDTRKWVASKLKPKVYGDKVQAEVSGPDGQPLTLISDTALERYLLGHMRAAE